MSTRSRQHFLKPLGDHTTKSNQAYRSLREAILDGTLEPGFRIRISRTAEDLRVSETPVREALKQLESEGLVVAEPHAGFAVAEISFIDVVENLLLRREIESLATRLAAPLFSTQDLKQLNRLVIEMDEASATLNWKTYARLNKRFHHTLISRCPLPSIRDLALSLWEAGDRTRRLFVHLTRLEASNAEHHEMLHAIEEGNYDLLDSLVRSQKSRGVDLLLSILDEEDRARVQDLIEPIIRTETRKAAD